MLSPRVPWGPGALCGGGGGGGGQSISLGTQAHALLKGSTFETACWRLVSSSSQIQGPHLARACWSVCLACCQNLHFGWWYCVLPVVAGDGGCSPTAEWQGSAVGAPKQRRAGAGQGHLHIISLLFQFSFNLHFLLQMNACCGNAYLWPPHTQLPPHQHTYLPQHQGGSNIYIHTCIYCSFSS